MQPHLKEASGGRRLSILSADDSAGVRQLLFELLSAEGHEVEFAVDGEQALGQARKKKYDLLILDVNMPKLDGYRAAQILSSEFSEPRPKVLIFTARNVDKERAQFLLSGADEIISKTLPIKEIRDRIYKLTGLMQSSLPDKPIDAQRPAAPKEIPIMKSPDLAEKPVTGEALSPPPAPQPGKPTEDFPPSPPGDMDSLRGQVISLTNQICQSAIRLELSMMKQQMSMEEDRETMSKLSRSTENLKKRFEEMGAQMVVLKIVVWAFAAGLLISWFARHW